MGYQLQQENEPLFLTKKQVKKKIRALFQQIDDNKDFSDYDNIEMKKQVLGRFYQEHHNQISRSTMLELHKGLTADSDMIDNILLGWQPVSYPVLFRRALLKFQMGMHCLRY